MKLTLVSHAIVSLFVIHILMSVQDSCAEDAPSKSLTELSLEELSQVRVTTIATGTKKTINEAPAVATVITAKDIQTIGATTLDEILETVPGIHSSAVQSGGGNARRYLIRGISTSLNPETLVLQNGIPLTCPFRGDRNYSVGPVPVPMIERIEIIRGPGSALYGADAFAGVINVITKDAQAINGNVAAGRIGSFDTQEAWFLHGATYGDLKASLMFDYFNTAGQSREITSDAQTNLDRRFGTNVSLAPGPINLSQKAYSALLDAETGKWHLRGTYIGKTNVGTAQGVADALDPNGRLSYNRYLVDLTYHDPKIAKDFDFTSVVSYLNDSQEVTRNIWLFPAGANLGNGTFTTPVIGNPEYWDRVFRFENIALYKGFENHQIRFGVGYTFSDLYQVKNSRNSTTTFAPRGALVDVTDTPDIYIPEVSRYDIYGLAQDEWRFANDWELTVGARYDKYSDFGGTFNPRAALVWNTTDKLTTKALYGHAFRAPSFVDLYAVNNPATLGNPNLKPETINVYEVSSAYQFTQALYAGLNLFHYNASDVITYVKNAGPIASATAQNYLNQTGNGLEFDSHYKPFDALFLTGSYSYLHSIDDNTHSPSGGYPNNKIYFRSDVIPATNWLASGQFTWVGIRDRAPGDPRGSLKGYTSVDMTFRRSDILKHLTAAFSIHNLFDTDIREPSPGPAPNAVLPTIPFDLPQAGRSVYGELSYRL